MSFGVIRMFIFKPKFGVLAFFQGNGNMPQNGPILFSHRLIKIFVKVIFMYDLYPKFMPEAHF